MAEHWWTERCFVSPSLSFSDYLPTYLPAYLPAYLPTSLPTYLPTYVSIYLAIYLSVCLSVCLSIYLSLCHSISLSLYLCLSIYLSICKLENEAILRDFLNFWTWQRQNEAILWDFLIFLSWQHQKRSNSFKNGKLSAELTASYKCVLRFFHSICLNYCACHGKVMPGHTKCCTCHAKSSQQTWRSEAPKCNLSLEISARTS